jgi:hypothetical protein
MATMSGALNRPAVKGSNNTQFIQNDFNPADIAFSTLSTMSKAVLETMLPAKEGMVHSAALMKVLP